jgi:hypothetical protein
VFNLDPIHGGKYIIQPKRYANTVDVSAIRDLCAVVCKEGASRGILVTTSSYGADAYTLANNRNPGESPKPERYERRILRARSLHREESRMDRACVSCCAFGASATVTRAGGSLVALVYPLSCIGVQAPARHEFRRIRWNIRLWQ